MGGLNVVKCTSCGRLTPTKHGECIYCQSELSGRGRRTPGHEEPRALGSARRRFTRQSDDRIHYLVADAREPLPLEPGKLFVLGRDPRASLVVHAADVSRQHAEIDWDDHDPPRPLLCEVRSSNGTFLNGKRVARDAPQPLRSGDEIRLGETFTVTYLHVHERDLRQELDQRGHNETKRFTKEELEGLQLQGPSPLQAPPGFPVAPVPRPSYGGPHDPLAATRVFAPMTAPPARAPGGVQDLVSAMGGALAPTPPPPPGPLGGVQEGSLAVVPGGELLKRLHRSGASGLLTVYDGLHNAELLLSDGRCTGAHYGPLQGRAALERVASLRQGLYRFLPDSVSSPAPTPAPPPPGYGAPAPVWSPPPATQAQRRPLPAPPPAGRPPSAGYPRPTPPPPPPPPPRPLEAPALPAHGSLEQMPGHELLLAVEQLGATGTLTVIDGAGSGQVLFVDGLAEDAHLAGLSGDEALNYLASLRQGTFHFRPEGSSPLRAPAPASVAGPWAPRQSAALRAPRVPSERIVPLRKPTTASQRPALRGSLGPPPGDEPPPGGQGPALPRSGPRRRPPPLPRRPGT